MPSDYLTKQFLMLSQMQRNHSIKLTTPSDNSFERIYSNHFLMLTDNLSRQGFFPNCSLY